MSEQSVKDRKDLELAAKAAGIVLEWDGDPDDPENWQATYFEGKNYYLFNPHEDNDEAFKLAVKLRLNTLFPTEIGKDGVEVKGLSYHRRPLFHDPFAAVRDAIFSAAVELGRNS